MKELFEEYGSMAIGLIGLIIILGITCGTVIYSQTGVISTVIRVIESLR